MFTGIVEGKAKVVRSEYRGKGKRLALELPVGLTETQLGDSINVNGVCLTIVHKKEKVVELDLSPETIQRTTLSGLREGEEINVERALKLSDRLGGHIVTGHIDGIGVITEKRKEKDFLQIGIRVPESASRYIVQKGSIAIDGISLTVNEVTDGEIQVMIIPFTLDKTNLPNKKTGDPVNVETDILGKYVERLMNQGARTSREIDLSFLSEHGFIKNK
jgi:riboflavin synthase